MAHRATRLGNVDCDSHRVDRAFTRMGAGCRSVGSAGPAALRGHRRRAPSCARGRKTGGPLPSRFTGVPPHPADAAARCASIRVLSDDRATRARRQGRLRRGDVRSTGPQSAAERADAGAAESRSDRCLSGAGGPCHHSRGCGCRGVNRPGVPGLADDRPRELSDHVVCRTLRARRQAREPVRIQSAGGFDGATHVRGTIVRLGSLRRGGTVLRGRAPHPSRWPRILFERSGRSPAGIDRRPCASG